MKADIAEIMHRAAQCILAHSEDFECRACGFQSDDLDEFRAHCTSKHLYYPKAAVA